MDKLELKQTTDLWGTRANFVKSITEQIGKNEFVVRSENEILIEKTVPILKKMGIDLSPELLERFEGILSNYLYNKATLVKFPSLPEKTDLMHNLSVSAEAFIQSVKAIQSTVTKRPLQLPYEVKSNKAIKELLTTVDMWRKAAKTYPLTRKQTTDPFLEELIMNLATIHQEATGKEVKVTFTRNRKGEFVSDFVELIYKILEKLNYAYQSKESLKTRIEKVLKNK